MKISSLILLCLIIVGCDSNPEFKATDDRPAEELALIKRFNTTDSTYRSNANEIKKSEAAKQGKIDVSKFITDTLHSSAKLWPVIVHEITVVKNNDADFIDVTLFIAKTRFVSKILSEADALILHTRVLMTDTTIKNELAQLQTGDKALVSGSFLKDDLSDNIAFAGYREINTDDAFFNPQIEFNIDQISKQKN